MSRSTGAARRLETQSAWIGAVALGALAVLGACDEGSRTKVTEGAKTVGQKVDKGLDKLDTDEVGTHLAAAKQAVAGGTEPHEACSYAARTTATDATKASLDELKKLCELEVPLARATKAVVAAEKAKAEQPQAPSLTECASDEWAAMKTKIAAGPHASDATWKVLEARWTKVCPAP